MKTKRNHPLVIVFDLWKLLRNAFFLFILFFILNKGSDALWVHFGRIAFIGGIIFTILYIILKWLTTKYELDDQSFHIYKGIFTKTKQTVPFSKIHNVSRHTSFLHKLFKMTSLRFETSTTEEDTDVIFEVVSKEEADRIESFAASEHINLVNNEAIKSEDDITEHSEENRTIHFNPTRNDIIRASFTSLSFLLFIPLLASLYSKIDDIFHIENQADGLLSKITESWWIITIIAILFIMCSVAFGLIKTYLKYGKYEISSDTQRIYIKKGILEETTFSISKEKVQAIEIKQSFIKRLLGLAEVKLTCVGGASLDEDKLDINSLYPFLPVKRAYELVEEILPTYVVSEKMARLPIKSLWVRIFKPSWIWIIATAILFYFKPTLLGFNWIWWSGSLLLLVIIIVVRILDFYHTEYKLNKHFFQFKKGGLTTSLFLSKRSKIIEIEVSRNLSQKLFGLASIGTANRASPVYFTSIDDVPIEMGKEFYLWYMGRRNEVEIE